MNLAKRTITALFALVLAGAIAAQSLPVAAQLDLRPNAAWRLAGDWGTIGVQTTATATTTVNVRSTPLSVNNANIIGHLVAGQVVDIVGYEVVRAWTHTDVSRRTDVGYHGPSRWVNIQTGNLIGWVYIAFLTFP